MPGRDLCLLSLDGGGIRGLSSLVVLKQLMETIGSKAGLESPPRPCHYFDIIGGTSTGGLLAIMLGRLKMDIDACITAYVEMSDKIFQKRHHRVKVTNRQIQGRFDSEELERAIKKIIRSQGLDEDALLMDQPDTSCKVFVCATSKLTCDTVHLTSYRRSRGGSDRLRATKIWEAARATSAASSFFDPIRINIGKVGEEFIDGATGANNPIQELWNEAKDMFDPEPLESNLKCVVSIGTGVPSVEPFRTGLLEIGDTLVRISTETEKTAELFQRAHSDLDDSNCYFRFNVRNGLENIGLEDASQKDTIVAVTQRYIESQDTFKLMKLCASNLAERDCFNNAFLPKDAWAVQKHSGNANHEELLERLSDYDHEGVHKRLSRKRFPGTGQWFLEHSIFKAWFEEKGSASLWCSGIIGSGKTMIATAVVEAAKDYSKKFGIAVIYFYCEVQQRGKLKGLDFLASFIKQLLVYLATVRKSCPAHVQKDLSNFFGTKRSEPDFDDLADIFSCLFLHTPKTIYIIDGLDEFHEKEVEKVLRMVRKLFGSESKRNGSRILIFSRDQIAPYLSVTRLIPGTAHISTSLTNIMKDIQLYVQIVIEDKMCIHELTSDAALMDMTKQRLVEGASQMFLWVYLQVEALWDTCLTDDDIRLALANLPQDLEETYRRCLARISNRHRYALKVLRWVNYASRPLHVDELKEAVAFDLQDRAWAPDKIPDPASLISCCANLVVVDATDQRVRFAHSSVKQYLEKSCGGEIIGYPTDSRQGELDCGELCVSYLSFSNFGLQVEKKSDAKLPLKPPDLRADLDLGRIGAIMSKIRGYSALTPGIQSKSTYVKIPNKSKLLSDREKYKLLDYAVSNWAMQTKFITRQSTVWNRFQQLALSLNESWNFHPWIRGGRSQYSHMHGLFGWAVKERHIPLLELVLDLEPWYGLKDICNLPAVGGSMPSLHVASRLGFEDAVKLLLTVCAVNTTDGEGYTALHHAADKGHLEVAILLSSAKGAKVDIQSNDKRTPLWLAARNGREQIVSLLIQKRASLSTRDIATGRTPLSQAAGSGHEAAVKLLIEKGADVGSKDNRGRTPLSWAAERGNEMIVKLLQDQGANFDSRDSYGKKPISWAAEKGNETIVKLLLEQGARVDYKDNSDRTPLSWAASSGHEVIVKLLKEQGANIDSRDIYGRTPLMWAAESGHEVTVKLLQEQGANIDSRDDISLTPLMWAASRGHEAVVKLLLEIGADVDSVDDHGETQIVWAKNRNYNGVVKLLLEAKLQRTRYPE